MSANDLWQRLRKGGTAPAAPAQTTASGQWFWLAAHHGGKLGCSQEGRLRHGPAEAGLAEVMLFLPAPDGPVGFLIPPTQPAPAFQGVQAAPGGPVLPVILVRGAMRRQAGLATAGSSVLACALPPGPDGIGDVVFDRTEMGPWESFTLQEVPPWARPAGAALTLSQTLLAALPGTAATLASLAGEASAAPDLLPALLAALPRAQFRAFAAMVAAQPELAAKLARRLPGDPWLAALPGLARWNQDRTPAPPQGRIGPELDRLATAGRDGRFASWAHRLSAAARHNVAPRRGVCVLATARNEGVYLLEWLAYHRAIGVEHFFLYTNANTDGSGQLLAALAQAGVVTCIESESGPGTVAQFKAYGHALGLAPQILDYEWALVIDLDEFFAFDAGRFASIGEYAAWQAHWPADAVLLQWLVFASCGQESWRAEGVMQRFTARLPYVDSHVKTLLRPHLFLHAEAHVPVCDAWTVPVARTGDGALLDTSPGTRLPALTVQPTAQSAWINHYFFKSAEEWMWKWSRNRGDAAADSQTAFRLPDDLAALFARQYASPANLPDGRIAACAPGHAAALTELRALPGVAAAEARCQAAFKAQLPPIRAAVLQLAEAGGPASPAGLIAGLLRR